MSIIGLGWIVSLILFIVKAVQNRLRKICVWILKQGVMPRHIAFIMDGNRRYAVRHNFTSKTLGHVEGYKKLEQVKSLFINHFLTEVDLGLVFSTRD